MQNLKDLENVIQLRKSKDYTEDFLAAKDMAKEIQDFWHSKGYKHISVWVEPDTQPSGRRFYYIRSNIKFRVP